MPGTVTLGFSFEQGGRVSPARLHRLVEEATVTAFQPGDLAAGSVQLPSYGPTRPALARGLMHYDTTAGIEGLYFSFASASNASVLGWLCAMPRRECYCWANSGMSSGTPCFIGKPHNVSDPGSGSGFEYRVFDGCIFPQVWQYSGASGPDAAMFITLEAVLPDKPVKCMWAGLVPQALNVFNGAISAASSGSPLFVDYAAPGAFKFGAPTSRSFPFGVNLENNTTGAGAAVHGTGCAIEDIVA